MVTFLIPEIPWEELESQGEAYLDSGDRITLLILLLQG